MSYSGTVRCGYCYTSGHNRLGCPDRRKFALENPESYESRRWHREQEERKRQVENRVCSYCKEPKHNRRGCKLLKEDRSLVVQRQDEYRKEFYHATSSAGLGPGSLVRVPLGSRNDEDGIWSKGYVAMVTRVHWHNVDFLLKDTDLTRGWRERDRALFQARVVSPFGYTEEDESYYRSPPRFNEVKNLSVLHVHKLLSPAINESDFGVDGDLVAELVGPVKEVPLPPQDSPDFTPELNSRFHFDPGPRSDEYDKKRPHLSGEQWRRVRPEEHRDLLPKE